jgi:hypothetical protein
MKLGVSYLWYRSDTLSVVPMSGSHILQSHQVHQRDALRIFCKEPIL